MDTSIVSVVENIPVVSHRVIAEQAGVKEKSVLDYITRNQTDFEEFGTVRFQIAGLERVNSKGQNRGEVEQKTYLLNEQQATLLMTYLKNTEVVRTFKKALVKAFFELRTNAHVRYNVHTEGPKQIDLTPALVKELQVLGPKRLTMVVAKALDIPELLDIQDPFPGEQTLRAPKSKVPFSPDSINAWLKTVIGKKDSKIEAELLFADFNIFCNKHKLKKTTITNFVRYITKIPSVTALKGNSGLMIIGLAFIRRDGE